MAFNGLYNFYRQEETVVNKAVLALLVMKKDIISKSKIKEINKLYEYVESIEEDIKSQDFDFDQHIINQQIIKLLEVTKINDFVKNPQGQRLFDIMLYEFSLISAATNSISGIGHYTETELEEVIKQNKYNGDLIFYRTLRQAILGFNTYQYANIVGKNLLQKLAPPVLVEKWEDALLWSLCLQVLWKDFKFLDREIQSLILQNYFYVAITSGVLVHKYINEFLIDSMDFVDYMSRNKLIFDALQSNKENIPIFSNNYQEKNLNDIFKDYLNRLPDDFTKESQDKYILNLYSQEKNQLPYINWLKESLYIFIGVRRANLVDYNQRREKPEPTRYEQDLLDLTGWYFIKQKWSRIVEYFKKENQPVGLDNFFNVLRHSANLDNMDVVSRLLDFTEFLHEKKLLSPDKDLIIYHEQDCRFHWHKEVI